MHSLSCSGLFKLIHNRRNFLYDPHKGKGVLVDFGLAEVILDELGLGGHHTDMETERGY